MFNFRIIETPDGRQIIDRSLKTPYEALTPLQILEYRKKEAGQKAQRKSETIYYIKQKLSGLVLAAIGIIIPFVNDGDATASLIMLPIGIMLILTKEKVMMF